MYIHKIHKAGDFVLIKNYAPMIEGGSTKRRRKEKPTLESRKRMNDRKRAEKIQLLILANFDKGYHIILDYPKDDRPETYEEADRILTKYLYKISRKYKRQGTQFKYLATTERGKRRAALHHHLIIEGLPGIVEDLAAEWGDHIKIFKMYPDGGYKDLADYFVKAETKEELTAGKSRFHRSRNLINPQEKREKRSGTFKQEPKAPPGWRIIPESIKNGYNERVGIRYQSYLLHRDGPRQQPVKSKQKEDKRCILRESFKKLGGIFRKRKRSRNG